MYTSRVTSAARSSATPSRTQQSLSSSRRSSSLYSARASPFTPGFSQQRNQSFNRSLQTSQIIEETAGHIVENYGGTLPVLVTEVLAGSDRGIDISVKLSESGWAWLVCGRRLFIWRYKQTLGARSISSQCKELLLPPSDLAHKAELVCVFSATESQVPSAIAVSPEGNVRYWPSIAHEGSSVETSAELHGQECYSLSDAQPLGCILATTTSTLVFVTPDVINGQNTITCRNLKIPQGMLAGIGRRMSSLIFGSMPNQSIESKLIKVLVEDTDKANEKFLYVLTGNHLQKWQLSEDKLLFECDIERYFKEKLLDSMWGREFYHVNQVQTWLIDMQLTRKGLVILAAGMNPQVSTQLHYAFGTLETSDCPTGFSNFIVANHTEHYEEKDEDVVLGFQFLLSGPDKLIACMYSEKTIYCFSVVNSGTDASDKVEFRAVGDKILGGGSCDDVTLFFSNNHGIISLIPTNQQQADTSKISGLGDLSMCPSEMLNISTASAQVEEQNGDKTARLKSAFLLFCKQNQNQSQAIVDDMFPPSLPVATEPDSNLDIIVVSLSQELIDDYPASDPRWAESVPKDAAMTSSSLILLHQLEDKQKAHDVFISFLNGVGIWTQLTQVTVREMPMSTKLFLCEHAEKLVAAISLRNIHAQFSNLIERALKYVLAQREVTPAGKLTNQDLFYREISTIDEIIPALIICEEEEMASDKSMKEIVQTVMSVNAIIKAMLQEACLFRVSSTTIYQIPSTGPDTEYIPWTASPGNNGMRNLLLKQHATTVQLTETADEISIRGNLYQQQMDLADLILDGYSTQLDSISRMGKADRYAVILQRFQQHRSALINPLLEAKQYDRATAIAEKYCDFGILIQMCEETENQERLQRYMTQFAEKGFSEFVFKWYLDSGKRGKLLSQPIPHNEKLGQFLEQHQMLSWLHDLNAKNYNEAQETLHELAKNEKDILGRKKTLMSLSKLTALVTDQPAEKIERCIDDIINEEELILHQETLPASLLESYGFDLENMRVLSPVELIEMYISEENVGANEVDFKKALDLLHYLDKDTSSTDPEPLKLHIWCQAILRDRWTDIDTDNPIEFSQSTIFYKLAKLIFYSGLNLKDYLPSLPTLLDAEELGELKSNSQFKFVIQATFEHFQQEFFVE